MACGKPLALRPDHRRAGHGLRASPCRPQEPLASVVVGLAATCLPGGSDTPLYGLLVAGREAIRLGNVARRDIPDLVLSSLLTGVATP